MQYDKIKHLNAYSNMVTFTKISREVTQLSKLVSNIGYLNPDTCTEV